MKSYDYAQREGVEEIDWQWFAGLARKLAQALASLLPAFRHQECILSS